MLYKNKYLSAPVNRLPVEKKEESRLAFLTNI